MMILNLSSSMQIQQAMLARGDRSNFTKCMQVSHVEVNGKVLGIVGAGNIGREVIKVAQALGMKVLAYVRTPRADEDNLKYVSFEELLKQSDYDLRLLIDGVEVQASAFSEYRAEIRNPLPMIYQSGYLTIKGYDKEVSLYTLGFPNDEVRYGFLNFLIPYYTEVSDAETGFYIVKFMRELRSGNVDAFMERLKVFFAGMPYELSENTERHYQAIFYVVFTLMGQFVETEVRSARGRADAVVKTKDFIFVFEFKLNGTAEEALKQIDEKGYLIPYTLDGRKLVKVGVNFSKEKRNIDCYVIG